MDGGEALAMMTVFACGTYLIGSAIRVVSRRMELKYGRSTQQAPAALPANLEDRLSRIEQAVDSIAIEVERISEGQRFTTKLLAGMNGRTGAGGAPLAPGAMPDERDAS